MVTKDRLYDTGRGAPAHLDRPGHLFREAVYSRAPHLGVPDPRFLAAGTSVDEILHNYPQLARDDVPACIAYGSEMSRERYVDIPLTKPA